MKNYLTIATILIFHCTGSIYAQPNARFTISTTGTISLMATIDGVNYSLPNMAQTWFNIQPVTLNVIVYQYKNNLGSEAGYKEVYNGQVRLSAGRHTELVVSRWGKVMFDETDIISDNWSTGIPGIIGPVTGGGNGYWGQVAVTDAAFAEIKKSLEEEKFRDAKMKLAKVIFKNNAFNSEQIGELSAQFNFDSDKLEFLKFAYAYCVDKGNYHVLARLLKFPSDRDALLDFISKQ